MHPGVAQFQQRAFGRGFLRALGVLCALIATLAQAQTVTSWKGSGTAWATNGNWTNSAPAAGGIAQFDSNFTGSSNPTGPTSNTSIGGLYFTSSLTKGVTINGGSATLTLSGTTVNGTGSTGIDDSSAQAITINQNLALSASVIVRSTSATGGSLTLGGTVNLNGNTATVNAGASAPITFSGVISGTGGITAGGPGTLTLSNTANTYSGVTTINAGTLSVVTLANSGSNSSIGKSSNAASNLVINGGTLKYTGAGSTTNRLFTIGTSGATLDASGAGALTFTNTGTLALSTTTGNRTLTLAGTNTGNNTLTAVIANPSSSGATSLTKTGNGTWVLANTASTYTGVTTINGGTLSVVTLANSGANSSIGKATSAASNLVINGGTLKYTGSSNASTNRLFTIGTSGATLDASGTGTLTFSNTSSLALASTNTSTTLTLTGTNTGANTLTSAIVNPSSSGTTSLVKSGSGTWVLGGTSNTYSGSTQIQAGTLRAGAVNSLSANSAVVLTNTTGATLDLNSKNNAIGSLAGGGASGGNVSLGGGTLTAGGDNTSTSYGGVISGTGGLTKAGSGTLSFTNTANTYTGATTINGGTLSVVTLANSGANSSIGAATNAASNLVINGGTLQYTGSSNASTNRLFTIGTSGATIDASGSGTVTFSNTSSLALASTNTSTTLTLTGTNTNANTLASNIVNPSSSGATSLVKNGAGTWVLTGTGNTYSGSTTISAGTLRAGGANTLSSNSAVVLATGATLDLNNNSNTIGSLAGTGGSVTLGSATLTAGGNNTSTTFAGAISGTGGLTKNGTGTLILSGTNTYTGATTINAGTLQAGSAAALSSSTAVTLTNTSSANLALNGNNVSVGSLAGGGASGGNVQLGSGTLTVGGDNTSTTYSGVISGSGGLVKNGSGTLTVAGNNSYTGSTTINLGTLKLGAAGSAGNGPLGTTAAGTTVNSGGALDLNGFTLANAEATTLNGSGVSSSGALTNSSSTAATYSGAVTLGSSTTIGGTGNITLSGALADSGSAVTLTKVGANTLNFNAAAGTITSGDNLVINGGTVAVNASNALGTSGPNVTINATTAGTTAALTLGGSVSQTIGSLTFGGSGATSTSTNNVTIGSSGTLTVGGNVTYDATNNPNGATISGGTLGLGNSVRTFNVGDSSNAASDLTVSSVISGGGTTSGGLTKTGNGTLTLSGANTFTGLVNVNAGTLAASGTTAIGGFAALGDHSWVAGPTPTTVVTVANGATLSVSSTNTSGAGSPATQQYQNMSLSGTGSGSGALVATGGTNTWLGNISLAGDTTIANTVAGNGNALFLGPLTAPSPTSFALNNHTLTFTGSGVILVSGMIGNSSGDTGSVLINMTPTTGSGVGYVEYYGAQNYYTGTTTIQGGTLLSIVNNGNHPNSAILGNLIIGTGTGAADTAVFQNYYSDQIADSAAVTINSDGKLDLGAYGRNETVGALTLNGGHVQLTGTNSGNLYLGADVHVTGGLTSTIDGDAAHTSLYLNSSDTNITASARTFNVDTGSTLLVNTAVRDRGVGSNGGFIKDGAGTMILTGDSTSGYGGITEVKNGVLNIRNSGALGQSGNNDLNAGTIVDAGGTLQVQNNLSVGNEALKLTGTGYGGNGALENVSGSNVWSGAVTMGDDTRIQSDSGQLKFKGGITADSSATNASHTLTVGGTGNVVVNGGLNDGAGSSQVVNLTKVDSGMLTLTVDTVGGNPYTNSFSGAIDVQGGTVTVTGDNALASQVNTVNVATGATFAVTGGSNFTNTIASVTGTGTVSIAGSTNLVVSNSTHDTFGGTLTGTGLFQKTGSGTLTFSSTSNTNSFYFGGTVELASNSTLEFQGGSGTKAVSTNALFINTLKLDTGTLLLSNAYINVGTLIITGNTILDFGTSGASVLNASNIYIASGATLTIKNWTSEVDYLFATNSSYATSGGFRLTDSNGNLAVFNAIGTDPENQVQFQGDPQSPDGSHTTWINNGYGGYTDWEIRPIPEPSTYGAIFLSGCLAFLGYRRYRRVHPAKR